MRQRRPQAGFGGGAARTALAALAGGALALAAGCDRLGGGDGQIRVTTSPAGASITCNGIPYELSPCTVGRLAPGTYVVTATKPGHREVRKSVSLLQGQRAAVDLKLEPLTGLLLVHSTPAGAQVAIDGADRGRTPLLVTDLPVGDHRLVFTMPGRLAKEIALSLEDRVPRKVVAELVSDAGTLRVRSEPAGAAVRVNGVERGTTPCELADAPSGENTVEVLLEGYQPFSEKFTLRAQEAREVMATLQPIPTRLQIVSVPDGARIYVDNQFRGNAPVTLTDLQPGAHRLRAELPGHEPAARDISLTTRADVVEEFRMVKNSAKIVVVSEPAGAKVFLNGEERGTTRPGASDVLSEPLEIDLLPPGEYRVQLQRPGYSHAARTVSLGANQVADLHEKLTRRFVPDTRVRVKWMSGEIVRDGMVLRELPNGDIELQLETGTIMKIRKEDVLSREPIRNQP